ncbi:MAG: hypothetical protein RL076_2557 [Chloroflexota bacterium]|jgi:hypothetical protein
MTSVLESLRLAHQQTNQQLLQIVAHTDEGRLRTRPHASMNSMVWSVWHSFRSEDACIARFVVPQQQAFTTGDFLTKMGVPYKGDGFGMSDADVTALSVGIDMAQLQAYGQAVTALSAQAFAVIADWDWNVPFVADEIRAICGRYADLADDDVDGTVGYATSMTRGAYLFKHLYGHSQYHLGEISAIDGQVAGKRFFTW